MRVHPRRYQRSFQSRCSIRPIAAAGCSCQRRRCPASSGDAMTTKLYPPLASVTRSEDACQGAPKRAGRRLHAASHRACCDMRILRNGQTGSATSPRAGTASAARRSSRPFRSVVACEGRERGQRRIARSTLSCVYGILGSCPPLPDELRPPRKDGRRAARRRSSTTPISRAFTVKNKEYLARFGACRTGQPRSYDIAQESWPSNKITR